MNALQTTIQTLSSEFARNILSAMRSASFEDILEETGTVKTNGHTPAPAAPIKAAPVAAAKKAATPVVAAKKAAAPAPAVASNGEGKRIRRSAEDIAETVNQIVELLQNHPDGLRSENIREELNLDRKFLPKPIAEALANKRITKSGEKRATVYKVRPAKQAKGVSEAEAAN